MDKFTEPLIETPQSITVVPQFVMQDQGLSTLRDSLRNVPGISLAAGEAGAQGDNLTIRGFTARNDIFLDGIRDFGSYYRDSFNYEQVEVLEGPAGIQFGRGSTGGVINQESKVPESREVRECRSAVWHRPHAPPHRRHQQPALPELGGIGIPRKRHGPGRRRCRTRRRRDAPLRHRAFRFHRHGHARPARR